MRIDSLGIGQRLALGFGLVLTLILVLTGIGIHRVTRIDDGLSTINQVNSVKQRHAINFRGSVRCVPPVTSSRLARWCWTKRHPRSRHGWPASTP